MDLTVNARGVRIEPRGTNDIDVELEAISISDLIQDIGYEDALGEIDDDVIKKYAIENLELKEEE